jgi:signal transduction histidine kinase
MLRGFLVTLVATSVSLASALLIAPAVNDAPVPLFLAGVVVSAWLGGLWPGLATTGLAAVSLARLFDLSRASPLPGPEDTALDLALFVAVAGLISWLTANVRSTNRRLDAARAEAEDAAAARDQLLAAAAHDLKSPLTEITMVAQLSRRRLEHTSTAQSPGATLVRQLATIEANAQRMAGLVDELLDAARLQAGRSLSLNCRPTALLPLVETAVVGYQRRTDSHALQVVPLADPVGNWDAARLARVLDNLLSNAIKYSPHGGEITVEVAEEDQERGSRMATVRVRDRGLGIPAAEMEHVFERFFRAANVGAIGGTGLGLAGSRRIVEQHGGTLTAESLEGTGSTFTLRLPIETIAASAAGDCPQARVPGVCS